MSRPSPRHPPLPPEAPAKGCRFPPTLSHSPHLVPVPPGWKLVFLKEGISTLICSFLTCALYSFRRFFQGRASRPLFYLLVLFLSQTQKLPMVSAPLARFEENIQCIPMPPPRIHSLTTFSPHLPLFCSLSAKGGLPPFSLRSSSL